LFGNTINAPTTFDISITGTTVYFGGGGSYLGGITVTSGSPNAIFSVLTNESLDGSPGCPCPCTTTISIDNNNITATNIVGPYTISKCQVYSYNIYYDYDDGIPSCTIIGFLGTVDACNATNYITTYSSDSVLGVGTVLYCDNTLTQVINAVVPYTFEPGQKYYKYNGNYITFETDNCTVHSISTCSLP